MIMLYFSGTGNSKFVAELFSREMNAACHSIEENLDFEKLLETAEIIGFCYPVYMSRVPRIMREFVVRHMELLVGKKLIIFCTQLILSGDGARAFAAMFSRNSVEIIYAEHFFMPNNVTNMFILPTASERGIRKCAEKSERKMQNVCRDIKNGRIKRRGFNVFSRFLGLFQGVFMSATEKRANNSVKITADCTNCGICVAVCPMNNLTLENEKITHKNNCTMCYRCINQCPKRAITVAFHGKVKQQYKGVQPYVG